MKDLDPLQLLTIEEVAALLRVARGFVYTEIRRDRLAALKVGRRLRVRAIDLDDYQDRCEVRPSGGAVDIDEIMAQG